MNIKYLLFLAQHPLYIAMSTTQQQTPTTIKAQTTQRQFELLLRNKMLEQHKFCFGDYEFSFADLFQYFNLERSSDFDGYVMDISHFRKTEPATVLFRKMICELYTVQEEDIDWNQDVMYRRDENSTYVRLIPACNLKDENTCVNGYRIYIMLNRHIMEHLMFDSEVEFIKRIRV